MGYQDGPRDDMIKNNFSNAPNPNAALMKNFSVIFPIKMTELASYVQGVDIPSIETGVAVVAAPNNFGVQLPGNSRDFPMLVLRFLQDDYMRAYTIIYEWANAIKDEEEGEFDDISRTIEVIAYDGNMIDETKTHETGKWEFFGAFPSSISGPSYDYSVTDSDMRTFSVNFTYSHLHYTGIQFEDIELYKC